MNKDKPDRMRQAASRREQRQRKITIGPATVHPPAPWVYDVDTGESMPAPVWFKLKAMRQREEAAPPPSTPGLGLDIPSGVTPAPDPYDTRPQGSPGVPRRRDLLFRALLMNPYLRGGSVS